MDKIIIVPETIVEGYDLSQMKSHDAVSQSVSRSVCLSVGKKERKECIPVARYRI